MFGSWISLFGSYLYVEINKAHFWYNIFSVTFSTLPSQYSNIITIRTSLILLLIFTTTSTLLTLFACEYTRVPPTLSNPSEDDIVITLRLKRARKLYIIASVIDGFNMICSIIAFSLFTDKVVPAFDEEYGMRGGRGEELSVAVSWENDNNNGHVDTGTDGRQDFTIASPTSSGSEGGTEMRRIGESMSLEFEGSNEKKPSGRQFEREKGTDDDDMDML
ncbi:hypothetical protein TrST_g9986 [Triparma strigata]|uniref:Uncharacterized protein n=2 Tax=Triparma TaxID=722752 RepID=A0A9W7BAI6_9STRA|nr:hypothetical protein TrST_g9986 [Triparma strigata]